MQVTTLTGESVTLVMPFQFAVTTVISGQGRVFIKAIGQNQWWSIRHFVPGLSPVLEYKVRDPEVISILNPQLPEVV